MVLRVIGLPGLLLARSLFLWCLVLGNFFFLGALRGRKGELVTSSVKTSSKVGESLLTKDAEFARDRSKRLGICWSVLVTSGGDGNVAAEND